MTKDAYFEMCDMLGTEPVEDQIPVEFDDFPLEMQQAFTVYRMLRDEWDGFSGAYFGKSFIGINEVMDATEIDPSDRKFIITLIRMIDDVRSAEIEKKKNSSKPAS